MNCYGWPSMPCIKACQKPHQSKPIKPRDMENNFFSDELPPWPEMDLTWPEMDLIWTNNSRITAIKQGDNSEITAPQLTIPPPYARYCPTLCARYSNITTRDIQLSVTRMYKLIYLSTTRNIALSTTRIK